MMEKKIKREDIGYIILYKFLKINGILHKYLTNTIEARHIEGDAKKILKTAVEIYVNDNIGEEKFINLFNWGPATFFWSASPEGKMFWVNYYSKWNKYRENEIKKYII